MQPSEKAKTVRPQRPSRPRLSTRRKLLFAAVTTVVVFSVVECALWLGGVNPAFVEEDPYAGFSRHIPHFVEDADKEPAAMSVSQSKLEVLNPQLFPVEKSDDVFRIVCLGGSTTYGRPFYDLTSFPGWLREFLTAAQPDRKWEVINAGAISYASYRVLGVMEELADYDPDLFIVYTGQNEFLERRTYDDWSLSRAAAGPISLIYRTRTATLVRGVLDATGLRSSGSSRDPALGEETKAIPVGSVGPEAYHRDEKLSEDVVRHFRSTLDSMKSVAQESNADLIFVVPASNLRDFAPFRSEQRQGLKNSQRQELRDHLAAARSSLSVGEASEALERLEAAEEIDDRYAEVLFLKGKALMALEQYDAARAAFLRARDEDVCPLRAIQPIVDSVRELAAEDSVSVVDFEQIAETHSIHQIPGDQMFHDHVHPTIEGNQLLALAIVDRLVSDGVVQPTGNWNDAAISAVKADVLSRVDRDEYGRQLRLLSFMMGWLGQPEAARTQAELSFSYSGQTETAFLDLIQGFDANEAPELAMEYLQKAVESVPESSELQFRLGAALLNAGQTAESVEHLRRAVDLDPQSMEALDRLGIALAQQGALSEAETVLRKAVLLSPEVAVVRSNLGLVIAKQGRPAEALELYEQSLKLDNTASSTHFNAGLASEELGQLERARQHYRATIELANGHEEAERRLQAIFNK